MSALFWIFGLGALAVAFPFLFHLIRRTPRGEVPFSSLMFLKPSPPSLTRRSRLDNWLLLLLRMAAVILIATAFMRPYWRDATQFSPGQVAHRRIAILVDRSASMRRADLWQQAQQQLDRALSEIEPNDEVALWVFDDEVQVVIDFDEALASGSQPLSTVVREAFAHCQPGFARSDLGKAIVTVADQMVQRRESQPNDGEITSPKLQLIVISDLQRGSKIDHLQSYQWPTDLFVDFRTVVPKVMDNVTIQVLTPNQEDEQSSFPRIRVRNFADTRSEQFFVNWSGVDQTTASDPVPLQVPADEARVVEIEDPTALSAHEFVVTGDSEPFDNSFFAVPAQPQVLYVAYLGDEDPDDPEQMQFYLSRAMVESPMRTIRINKPTDFDELKFRRSVVADPLPTSQSKEAGAVSPKSQLTTLLVVTSAVNEDRAGQIENYLASGGTVFFVLKDNETIQSTARWTNARAIANTTAESNEPLARPDSVNHQPYAMLSDIDFRHPLFSPFDSQRYNDFTTIRFWNHRSVELMEPMEGAAGVVVVARFDDSSPALWECHPATGGRVLVLASGWHPRDSQLALSTKFVPLVQAILDVALDTAPLKQSLSVNQAIEFMAADDTRIMIKPDLEEMEVKAGATRFEQTDLPGIYRLVKGETDLTFAVNLDRAESETEPLPLEQLEMFALKIGRQSTSVAELAQLREKRDRELENQQKLWKWLILAAVTILVFETWLAGRTGNQRDFSANKDGTIEPIATGVTT